MSGYLVMIPPGFHSITMYHSGCASATIPTDPGWCCYGPALQAGTSQHPYYGASVPQAPGELT